DIFISKLDSSGNFVWAKTLGGAGIDDGRCIITDDEGNIYFSGSFSGTCDFNPDTGVYNLTSAGNNDAFVCKLDSNGNFILAKQFASQGYSYACSLLIDDAGNLFVEGSFSGTVDFDPGPGSFNLTSF